MYQNRQIPSYQPLTIEMAQQNFLKHAALAEHYERLKIASADDSAAYYRYAELQYYHKSRAIHFKGYFSAAGFISRDFVLPYQCLQRIILQLQLD